MNSTSFLKDATRSVVLAGVLLGVASVVSAQVGGANGGGIGSIGSAGVAGSAGNAGSVGVPGSAGIGGGAGEAGSVGVPGAANERTIGMPGMGDAGSAGGMVSPKAVDSMTGQHGPMGGRPPYTSGSAVSGEAPPSPATSSASGSERRGYGFTGVAPGGGSTAPGATSGTGE
jgi:hypothetical protein